MIRRLPRYRLFGHPNLTGVKLLKFACANGVGAGICFGVGYALTEWAHVWYMASMFIGLVLGSSWNFVMNGIWTFGGKHDR